MAPKKVALARWTGRGRLERLRISVESVLRSHQKHGRVWTVGNSVVFDGPDPAGGAAILSLMPGVDWVAVGLSIASMREASRSAGWLARNYLNRGDRFSVQGEGTKGTVGFDIAGAMTSGILDAVRGTRVSETPKVRFRGALDGRRGVVGVEVRRGPGGVAMGDEWATCLVSGGTHSAVVGWDALLNGYRLRLVHAKVSDDGLYAVASLYSEFSHRVDPRGLELVVIENDDASGLASYLAKVQGRVFGGFHSCGEMAPANLSGVSAPLYLLPEERFLSEFGSLGVKGDKAKAEWGAPGSHNPITRRFAGWADDLSAVLDGLR